MQAPAVPGNTWIAGRVTQSTLTGSQVVSLARTSSPAVPLLHELSWRAQPPVVLENTQMGNSIHPRLS